MTGGSPAQLFDDHADDGTERHVEQGRVRRPLGWVGAAVLLSGLATPLCAQPSLVTPPGTPTATTAAAPGETDLPALTQGITEMARTSLGDVPGARLEVIPGQLDPRLKLAPCRKVSPYLPPGSKVWGRLQVGLRCVDGPVAWNVYLPVTVKVWAKAVVSTTALAAGSELTANDLQIAEVDLADSAAATFSDPALLIGRRLNTAVLPGTPLRADKLRVRQWFAAGDTVTVTYKGDGFMVTTEAQALGTGLEGQPVRVRVESGRILTGQPVGDRQVEVRS